MICDGIDTRHDLFNHLRNHFKFRIPGENGAPLTCASAMLIHYPLHIATAYFGALAYMMTHHEQASEAINMIPKTGMGIGKTIAQECIKSEAPGKAMSYAYSSIAAKSGEFSAQVRVAAKSNLEYAMGRVFGNQL